MPRCEAWVLVFRPQGVALQEGGRSQFTAPQAFYCHCKIRFQLLIHIITNFYIIFATKHIRKRKTT